MAARSEDEKILLLCDLNGTIVYRTENPIGGIKWTLHARKKYYYVRPDAVSFLKNLSTRYKVCIYSSVMMHNITELLDTMDRGWRSYIREVYDRESNRPDPNGTNEWDTIRDMDKIWSISGHSDRNTVILDNELRKFEEHSANGIVVPEYGIAQVRANSVHLTDLEKYLLHLADNAADDVRVYMTSNPWCKGWETVSQDNLALKVEKLALDPIAWGASMTFSEIKDRMIIYRAKGTIEYSVVLGTLDGDYGRDHQLARLLELGDGKHRLFKKNMPCDYSIADCKRFLSRDSKSDKN
jgi:hypothetical protein